MIVFSHPTGNANVRAVVQVLAEFNLLDSLHTTLAFNDDDPLLKVLPEKLKTELLRRQFSIDSQKIQTHPSIELLRLLAPKIGASWLTVHETGVASVDAVYRGLDRAVAKYLSRAARTDHLGPLSGVYCYEDGALETFEAAHQFGLKCFYDLPIAYWETSRRLLEEEALRLPEWAKTISGLNDSASKMERKTQELDLADAVICPSQFVYRSLPESISESKRCLVAEFGSSELPPVERSDLIFERTGVTRVLFVGSMSQRKGLADLFAAVKMLNRRDLELVILGAPVAPMSFYFEQLKDFTYEPPRSHHEVLKLMSTCDVLVLPSIVEGRALVQQEAMRCRLPIIVTANAGAEDLIDEGRTGFLIPIRNPEVLAEKLAWCADNRSLLREMGEIAADKASTVTWTAYKKAVLALIRSLTT